MLLPVWRHGQFPAPRSSFLPSLRWSHNFQEHGLKAPSPQRHCEILCVFLRFLRPFLFWGAFRSPRLSPPLPRSQTCLLPSPGPGRSCLPEARRRRAALSPAAARRLSGCAAPPTQVGDLRLLAAAACGPCLPRAPGIVAARRLLALLARLALFLNGKQPISTEDRPQRGSAFPVTFLRFFRGALGGFPDSRGTRAAERGGPVERANRGRARA